MSEARGKKKSLSEGPTCEGNPLFPCASCTNKAIKMFKATAALYNVLPFWELIPGILELIRICLDNKHFELIISENNEKLKSSFRF